MTRGRKILGGIAVVAAVAVVTLAITVSHNSPCEAGDPLPADVLRMKAVLARCYGSPDTMKVEEVAKPVPTDDQVLVRVHSASLNPVDWHGTRGSPYIMRLSSGIGKPTDPRVGTDFAGTVEAVGKNIKRYKPGDEVFGGAGGALGEYVVRSENRLALKPANMTFEQAGSLYVAAGTALQALRDHGQVKPGQKVLINGASGGVGTFSVQIAKVLGAEVTGVCSTRNVELVRSLGADHVIDYTKTDFSESGEQYDMILDNVANRSLSDLRRVLKPEGRLVIVGGAPGNWIGPLAPPIKAMLMSPFVDQHMGMMMADPTHEDLEYIAGLFTAGKVTPIIDKRFPFSESAEAMRYLEAGRARGKVVVNVIEPQSPSEQVSSAQ